MIGFATVTARKLLFQPRRPVTALRAGLEGVQSFRGDFQIRKGDWKYLDHQGSGGNQYDKAPLKKFALPEMSPEAPGQLYHLATDSGETRNLYFEEEAKRKELQTLLQELKDSGRSAPNNRNPIGLENIPRLR